MSESSGDEEDGGSNEVSENQQQSAAITAQWLECVLSSSQAMGGRQICVHGFRVSPASHPPDQPVLSDILAVRVDISVQEADEHLHLIVKLLPQEPFQRYFVTEAQFDLREIKFYTQVAEELETYSKEVGYSVKLPIPTIYHAHYGGEPGPAAYTHNTPPSTPPHTSMSVLVLEDLTHSGYKVSEFAEGLTLGQAESALRAVAKLHSASLGLKLKTDTPLDQAYPFLFQTARATDSYQQLVERGLPQLAMFLEGRPNTEPVMKALEGLKPATKEVISSLLAPREPIGLITHTDFWCNNLAFTVADPPECRILDWQMVTYSRPSNDVALLILSSVPTDLRRESTEALLDAYWDEFSMLCTNLGVDLPTIPYTRELFGQDYAESRLLALLLCIGSVDVALGNPATEQRLLDLLQDLYKDGVLTT